MHDISPATAWQVGGIDWFAREQRGMQALYAPEWKDPEKTVLSLRNLEARLLTAQYMRTL